MTDSILSKVLGEQPLIAILRGLTPERAIDIAAALYEAGIKVVEVPLNSPEPFDSISRIATEFAGRLVVGAGTLLTEGEVERVAVAGGQIALSPNFNPGVVDAILRNGMVPVPGVATPSEAFAALDAGAEILKIFPAATLGPEFLRQIRVVLPPRAKMLAVGGVTQKNLPEFHRAGALGFGIGAALYSPGDDPAKVARAAADYIDSCRGL